MSEITSTNPFAPTYEPPAWWDAERVAAHGTFWLSTRSDPTDPSTIRFLAEDGTFSASRARDGVVFDWTEVPEALEAFGGKAIPR